MGKGHPDKRRTLPRSARALVPPQGEDGYRVLARVRKALAEQRAGGPVFQPSAAERRVLEWLAFESGADLEMDRNPRFRPAFEVVAERSNVLGAIVDPHSVVPGLSYPLEIGEVVSLLNEAGMKIDQNAVRRLADTFGVPRLGGSERRVFFARHVLEVASAAVMAVTPSQVADLRRHLNMDLTAQERVLAALVLPGTVPTQATTRATRARRIA